LLKIMEKYKELHPQSGKWAERALNIMQGNLFKLALLNRGVDIMGAQGGFLSIAHSSEDIEKSLEAFEGALDDLQQEDII